MFENLKNVQLYGKVIFNIEKYKHVHTGSCTGRDYYMSPESRIEPIEKMKDKNDLGGGFRLAEVVLTSTHILCFLAEIKTRGP